MSNVEGDSSSGPAVLGVGTAGSSGIVGFSDSGDGVAGTSDTGYGVLGTSSTSNGVQGESGSGYGAYAMSQTNTGVYGSSGNQHGVHGVNGDTSGRKPPKFGCGVLGESDNGYGVYGASNTASGVYGTSPPGHLAGEFVGDVSVSGALTCESNLRVSGNIIGDVSVSGALRVSGNITLTGGDLILADCAEQFDVVGAAELEPGTVLVIDESGGLRLCGSAYDRKVAGVVSGAGAFKSAIVLDQRPGVEGRATVALVGKVYCKVDANVASIGVGDLLTSSSTPGHRMKVTDPAKAFGAVIGKALQPLASGTGLIPILVAMQ